MSFSRQANDKLVIDHSSSSTDNAPQIGSKTSTPEAEQDFARQANTANPGIVAEFVEFLVSNKKWWLIPILIVLALVGLLIVLSASPFAPFIYPIF